MYVIISNIFPIFLVIAIGFIANRRGILPNEANKYLVDMVMLVTCPCMIISSLLGQEMDPSLMTNTVLMFAGSAVFFALFYFIAWVVVVKIMKVPAEQDAGVYMIMFTTVNNGFIGFPVTYAIFGDEILFYMVIFQIMLIVYVYSAGVIQVNYGSPRVSDLKGMARALVNTCTIATLISVILLFLKIRLPEILFDAVELVGSATTPVSMLVVGMQLGNSNFKKSTWQPPTGIDEPGKDDLCTGTDIFRGELAAYCSWVKDCAGIWFYVPCFRICRDNLQYGKEKFRSCSRRCGTDHFDGDDYSADYGASFKCLLSIETLYKSNTPWKSKGFLSIKSKF